MVAVGWANSVEFDCLDGVGEVAPVVTGATPTPVGRILPWSEVSPGGVTGTTLIVDDGFGVSVRWI